MKYVLTLSLVLVSLTSMAQLDSIPPREWQAVDLRLEMASDALDRSARWGEISVVSLIAGGALAALFSTPDSRDAIPIAYLGVAGFSLGQFMQQTHKRRASKALIGQME